MKNKLGFSLITVNKSKEHVEILFSLLKQRAHNISHEQMPDFKEHELFVFNHPFREWFLVKSNNVFVGSIYVLDNNCIGINIDINNLNIIKKSINWILSEIKPLPGIKSVRNKNFHININPDNKKMTKLLNDLNAKLIEHTYIIK